jgi:thioredoxin reductase (NADPH)
VVFFAGLLDNIDMAKKEEIFAKKPKEGQPWDVVIIGSGPAAFTAAIYTTRGAASTLILGGDTWGGQLMLTTTVDNFPGFPEGIQGPELMQKMREQAERFGVEFKPQSVTNVDFDKDPKKIFVGDEKYLAKAVIVATGAHTRWLNVPGEDNLRGRGVSSCAPCDAPFFKDREVLVVGGGDSAMEEALVLTKYATSVTIVHRRDKLKASGAMQKKIFEKQKGGKINILWDTEVAEMIGEEKLEKVLLKTKKDSEQAKKLNGDELQKYRGEIKNEKEGLVFWEIPIDGLFVAIGHVPATDVFNKELELDKKGYVVPHHGTRTSKEDGVFVAGDVHDYNYRQAITAAAYGCMAGIDALKYLDKSGPAW